MASRNILNNWFSTGKKPLGSQFANAWNSFWHKDEDLLPITSIDNLQETLADKADKSYVDGAVVGLLDDRGNWDASSGSYPNVNGSGPGGAIRKGDMWFVETGGNMGAVEAFAGDSVRALQDNASWSDNTKWAIMRKGAAIWGSIGGNIGNQGDLVALLNQFAHYNILIGLTMFSVTGLLADITLFEAAVQASGNNSELVINSFIQDGKYLKINCTGFELLPENLFAYNDEILSFKDLDGQIKTCQNFVFYNSSINEIVLNGVSQIGNQVFTGCTILRYVHLQNCMSIGDECFKYTLIESLSLPSVINMGGDVFLGSSALKNLIVLKRSDSVTDIESDNAFTAHILTH